MTLSQQAPSLVERLNDEHAHEGETVAMIMVRWNAQRQEAAARITELEGDLKAALREVSRYAREAGEAKGRLEMSEAAGIVDGWRERAERAEARIAELEEDARSSAGALFLVKRGLTVATARAKRAEAQCRVLQEALQEIAGSRSPSQETRASRIARQALSLPESPSADAEAPSPPPIPQGEEQ